MSVEKVLDHLEDVMKLAARIKELEEVAALFDGDWKGLLTLQDTTRAAFEALVEAGLKREDKLKSQIAALIEAGDELALWAQQRALAVKDSETARSGHSRVGAWRDARKAVDGSTSSPQGEATP